MEEKKLLEVENLAISFNTYAGEVQAVRGISFYVNEGEILGIVGESGCGKSVTSNAIMRILPEPPAIYKSGAVNLDGRDLLNLSEREMQEVRGNEISMIFQDSMSSLNPTTKVGKQISEAILRHQKITRAEANKIALDMLTAVGISTPKKRFEQYPHEFSGGMRQRAMIAMALTCNPKLLIADEPTTALDVTIQAQILTIMKKLIKSNNTAIILITHDLAVVAETCDRVVVMYAGQIIESANIKYIFENMKHPYTMGLLDSVPSMTMDQTKELTPIIGSPPDLIAPPKGCGFYARCKQALKICKDYEPEKVEFTEDDGSLHCVKCWLYHEEYLTSQEGK
ncbi:MAG: ABC transporter ATP-binding protein [Lachnospirales bacterium]